MINVCFITDERYVIPTLVAIKSLIVNSQTPLSINVVTTALSNNSQQLFRQLETNAAKINIIFTQNPCKNIQNSHHYITNTAYIKLNLPNIFNDLDKILYIDGDSLILKDLKELYDTDLEDKYAGVVLDVYVYTDLTYFKEEGLEKYFNSGVMLMNLAKMRQESIVDKLLDYAQNGKYRTFVDQDALNVVFQENVKWLSIKHNFLNLVYDEKFITENLNISAEEYNKIENSITISHYAGVIMDKMIDFAKDKDLNLWYEYYNMLLGSYNQNESAMYICTLYQRFLNNNISVLRNKIRNLEQQTDNLQHTINILNTKKEKFFQKIFSVTNKDKHKVITIFFIKIKFKIKNSSN